MKRTSNLHRICTALLTMFALLVSNVEVLLPELHDGDARTESTETHPEGASTALFVSHDSVADQDAGAPTTPPEGTSHHGVHIDHCGHSHAATNARMATKLVSRVHERIAAAPVAKLASFELPPHVRPPIL